MHLDILLLILVTFIGALCYFKGLSDGRNKSEQTLRNTLNYFMDNGYIRWSSNEDGTRNIIPLDDEDYHGTEEEG
jgi:hypothetical protein